eukprot:PhM_4_TR18503/c0_g1_i1/m.25447
MHLLTAASALFLQPFRTRGVCFSRAGTFGIQAMMLLSCLVLPATQTLSIVLQMLTFALYFLLAVEGVIIVYAILWEGSIMGTIMGSGLAAKIVDDDQNHVELTSRPTPKARIQSPLVPQLNDGNVADVPSSVVDVVASSNGDCCDVDISSSDDLVGLWEQKQQQQTVPTQQPKHLNNVPPPPKRVLDGARPPVVYHRPVLIPLLLQEKEERTK